jgi:hypothetical protein
MTTPFAFNNDPRHRAALAEIGAIYARYDLAGGCVVVDEHGSSYRYVFPATWNAFVEDPALPLGIRIRAKTAELGVARAQAFMEGTGWTLGALRDFARMTEAWMHDMMQMLRRHGVRLSYRPFGGATLPRLTAQKPETR